MSLYFPKLLLDFERGVAGRSKFDHNQLKDITITLISILIAEMLAVLKYHDIYSSISLTDEITFIDRILYSSILSLSWMFFFWIILITLARRTRLTNSDVSFIPKIPLTNSNAILGIFSAFIILNIVEWSFDILLISTKWDIVWANRAGIMIGPEFTRKMTQTNLDSEIWRFWPIIYLLWALIGSAYGVSDISARSFILSFSIFYLHRSI